MQGFAQFSGVSNSIPKFY